MSDPLNALYFPWVAIQRLETLKRALIYFDKIYVLVPPYGHVERLLESTSELPEAFRPAIALFAEFLAHTAALRDAGVLELVDPYRFGVPTLFEAYRHPAGYSYTYESTTASIEDHLRKIRRKVPTLDRNSTLLSESILSDLSDPGFCALDTDLEVFFHGNLIADYDASGWTFSEFHGYNFHEMGGAYSAGLREIGKWRLSEGLFRGGGSTLMAYLGQSLIINRTIIAAHELEAVPFTDQEPQVAFLRNKYDRLAGTESLDKHLREFVVAAHIARHELALRVVETHVPNLEDLHWDDILAIREHAKDELEHFRVEVAKLASQVKAIYGTENFDKEVAALMDGTVNPAVVDLKLKFKLSGLTLLQQALKKAQSLKPVIPFALSFFFKAPLIVALATSAGVLAAETALDAYIDRKKIKGSTGLSYLFNFK